MNRLRRLAEAATPGPWQWSTYCGGRRYLSLLASDEPLRLLTHNEDAGYDVSVGNAEYIAATDPTTLLSLIDELDRQHTAIAQAALWLQVGIDNGGRLAAIGDALRALETALREVV
jgi:hypothetical protein